MKIKSLIIAFTALALSTSWSAAQETTQSQYNPAKAFAPLFYTSTATQFRSATGYPGPQYWQNRADYDIKATLNTQDKSLQGHVTIRYTNNSPDALDYLWLQLDQNLFAANSRGKSLISGQSRYGDRGKPFNGGYKIAGVTVTVQGKTIPVTTIIEDTRMQIRLASALAPKGGIATINIAYSFIIPQEGSDRTGWLQTKNGVIYSVAQWYPRMCVYDDVLGWNTYPYYGAGEFYCEYGNFTYAITAPANQVVLGSGELVNAQSVLSAQAYAKWQQAKGSDKVVNIITAPQADNVAAPATKTWIYKMENSRDVAFASSNAFLVDGVRIKLPSGRQSLAVSAQPAESYTTDGWQRGAEFTKGAIEHYSSKWFEYPYPMAVNIASNVGGMEYPGLVFCSWRARGSELWSVTSHEFGHTWFPMIVGSNERKFGWMDEGFNTFINGIADKSFNNGEFAGRNMNMTIVGKSLLGNPRYENIMQTPDGMREQNIGINLYMKPGMALNMLRDNILGPQRFDYAFRQYIKHWAYKHPTPMDFFRSMENGAGEDLSYFWRSWFFENDKFDQGITGINKVEGGYNVVVSNNQQMVLPNTVKITYTDGTTETVPLSADVWLRNTAWPLHITTSKTIAQARLDADERLPDANRANDTFTLSK